MRPPAALNPAAACVIHTACKHWSASAGGFCRGHDTGSICGQLGLGRAVRSTTRPNPFHQGRTVQPSLPNTPSLLAAILPQLHKNTTQEYNTPQHHNATTPSNPHTTLPASSTHTRPCWSPTHTLLPTAARELMPPAHASVEESDNKGFDQGFKGRRKVYRAVQEKGTQAGLKREYRCTMLNPPPAQTRCGRACRLYVCGRKCACGMTWRVLGDASAWCKQGQGQSREEGVGLHVTQLPSQTLPSHLQA